MPDKTNIFSSCQRADHNARQNKQLPLPSTRWTQCQIKQTTSAPHYEVITLLDKTNSFHSPNEVITMPDKTNNFRSPQRGEHNIRQNKQLPLPTTRYSQCQTKQQLPVPTTWWSQRQTKQTASGPLNEVIIMPDKTNSFRSPQRGDYNARQNK